MNPRLNGISKLSLFISPNPINNDAKLAINSSKEEIASIIVVNSLGEIIFENEIILQKGQKEYNLMNTEGLPSGVYMVILKTSKDQGRVKFIKQN